MSFYIINLANQINLYQLICLLLRQNKNTLNDSMKTEPGHKKILQLLSKVSTKNFDSQRKDNYQEHLQSQTNKKHSFHNPQNGKKRLKQLDLSFLRQQIQLKQPWRLSGLRKNEGPFPRLSHRHELDNWQISRIQLSNRSFDYPKQFKGMKIPEKGKQFITYNSKDKNGHLPYLYPSEVKKYQSLKQKLTLIPFKVTNSVRHDYFGFGTLNRHNQRKRSKAKSQYFSTKQVKLQTNHQQNISTLPRQKGLTTSILH